jgi:hypothetical protein
MTMSLYLDIDESGQMRNNSRKALHDDSAIMTICLVNGGDSAILFVDTRIVPMWSKAGCTEASKLGGDMWMKR